MLQMGKKQFLSMWFSGPARNKTPRLSNSPGTPLPSVGRAVAELSCSQGLGTGTGLSHEDVAEETEADDDHTKPNPSSPLFSGVQI